MLVRITKIEPKSLAKTLMLIQGIVGLMIGTIFSFMALAGAAQETGFGIWSIFALPVMNAVIGFLSGWLLALLYNFLVKQFGGIEIDMEGR